MAASEELARRVVEAGRSCSLTTAVPEGWSRLGTPKQVECVPSSKNRQIRLSNFDTLMLTASGRAGAVAAGPPAA